MLTQKYVAGTQVIQVLENDYKMVEWYLAN